MPFTTTIIVSHTCTKCKEVVVFRARTALDTIPVAVHLQTTISEIKATDGKVTSVAIIEDGKPKELAVDGVFIFVGLKPNTQFLASSGVALDEQKLVKTDETYHTNMPGVFASGDVRSGATMQVASAVGEGASAALAIRHYLEDKDRN
jgi:thioredoxin reductase (NADPH)